MEVLFGPPTSELLRFRENGRIRFVIRSQISLVLPTGSLSSFRRSNGKRTSNEGQLCVSFVPQVHDPSGSMDAGELLDRLEILKTTRSSLTGEREQVCFFRFTIRNPTSGVSCQDCPLGHTITLFRVAFGGLLGSRAMTEVAVRARALLTSSSPFAICAGGLFRPKSELGNKFCALIEQMVQVREVFTSYVLPRFAAMVVVEFSILPLPTSCTIKLSASRVARHSRECRFARAITLLN